MEAGERLRILRESRGISMNELAQRSSVSRGTIANIEKGAHSPSLKNLEKIAATLGVSVFSLLVGEAGDVHETSYKITRLHPEDRKSIERQLELLYRDSLREDLDFREVNEPVAI